MNGCVTLYEQGMNSIHIAATVSAQTPRCKQIGVKHGGIAYFKLDFQTFIEAHPQYFSVQQQKAFKKSQTLFKFHDPVAKLGTWHPAQQC